MEAPVYEVGPRVVTSDGVGIATYDLGGVGPTVLLAHATGFHGRVWLPLVPVLGRRHHCVAFDCRGHGASDQDPSGRYDWAGFGRDVLAVAEEWRAPAGADHPLRAVGHSAGGAALLLAEEEAPGTFADLYLYEPVVPVEEWMADFPSRDALALGAQKRRPVFASRAVAREHFAAKGIFSRFDPAALDAYVEWGFIDQPDGTVTLACRPEDEARTYEAAVSNDAFGKLDRVGCPVTLAVGGQFPQYSADVAAAIAGRLPGPARVEVHPELGHFGPLERPGEVAVAASAAFDHGYRARSG